jgi:Arc/MetJ-type ribon-helix-helix transcriptional regulator
MEVRLTPEQEAFVRQAIETGRLQRAEDAVREAPLSWTVALICSDFEN